MRRGSYLAVTAAAVRRCAWARPSHLQQQRRQLSRTAACLSPSPTGPADPFSPLSAASSSVRASQLTQAMNMTEQDFEKHMSSGSFQHSDQAYLDQQQQQPGSSEDDAFGETDPMRAIESATRRQIAEREAAAKATHQKEEGEENEAEEAEEDIKDGAAAAAADRDTHPATRTITETRRRRRREGNLNSTAASSQGKTHSGEDSKVTSSGCSTSSDPGAELASVAGAAASEAITEQTKNRRHRRRRRSVDTILGDVLHDALKLRDMGHKPTADFVYKRSQERMYEEEYGHKPPSAKEHAMKYIPFPPDLRLHRLLPLERFSATGDPLTAVDALAEEEETVENTKRYSKHYMHTYRFAPEDPWPARAITSANPVWTNRMVALDKQATNGDGLKAWERKMYQPREGYDVAGEFCDAMDELAYWEVRLLHFLREAPLAQRRSLPYLHEFYRMFVHRTIRAERRYIATRNAALAVSFRPSSPSSSSPSAPGASQPQKEEKETVEEILEKNRHSSSRGAELSGQTAAGKSFFNRTEESVERVRAVYAEAHRSLSSPNYDPIRMKKSALAPFMRMTKAEFEEWQRVQKQRRNALVAELS